MRKRTKKDCSILRIEHKCDLIIDILSRRGNGELDYLIKRIRESAEVLSEQTRAEVRRGYGR